MSRLGPLQAVPFCRPLVSYVALRVIFSLTEAVHPNKQVVVIHHKRVLFWAELIQFR